MSIRNHVAVTARAEPLTLAPKDRAVLAALATAHPGAIEVDRIAPLVWVDSVPPTARQAIRNSIMRIRRQAAGLIETEADAYRFADAVTVDGSGTGVVAPLADLDDSPDVDRHRRRWTARIAREDEVRLEGEVESGVSTALIDRLEVAVADEPYREQRWYLLVRAQAGLGDRRSALAACDKARRTLAEVGLRPDDRLRDLERRILDSDPALRVGAVGPSTAPVSSPIVGIDHLVRQLADAVSEGRATTLVGTAGSGKTTLIDEVIAAVATRGWRTLSSRCSSEPSVPLEPFSELALAARERDTVTFDRRTDRAGLGVLFPRLPPIDGDTAARGRDRDAMFDDVVNLLVESPLPTLIVVEDIHWASPSTLGLLGRLLDAAANNDHAAIITTTRESNDDVAARSERVDVEPWSPEVVGNYVDHFIDSAERDYAAALASWLHDQTSGHPLFVRELAIAAVAQSPVGQPFAPPSEVPELVLSAVSNRLGLLGRSTRDAVEVAAMLGAAFHADDIVALVPAGLQRIAEAIDADIVRRSHGDVYQFRHELFRRVVLDQLAPGRQVELHDVIAAYLAERRSPDRHAELAAHASAARSLDPGRALESLLRSADLHTHQVAWDEAAAQFGEALGLIEATEGRSTRWCETAIRAGQCRIGAGIDGSVELLIGAARLAMSRSDDALTATAIAELCRLGPTSEAQSVSPDVATLLDDAIATVQGDVPRAHVLGAAAMSYAVADPPRGERYFNRSIELAERAADVDARLEVLPLAIVCLAGPDHLERRESIAAELEILAARSDDPMVGWGAQHLHMTARIERGDPAIRSSLAKLHEYGAMIGSRSRQFEREYWSGAVALIDGDLDLAELHTVALSTFVGSIAESRVVALQGGLLLGLRLVQGRAGELVDGIRSLADAQPDVGAWHAALSVAAVHAADDRLAGSALRHLLDDDGRRIRNDSTYTAALLCAAEAAAAVGTPAQIDWLEQRLAPLSGRWSYCGSGTFGPLDLPRARLALAAGDHAAGRRLATQAREQADRFGSPIFAELAGRLID